MNLVWYVVPATVHTYRSSTKTAKFKTKKKQLATTSIVFSRYKKISYRYLLLPGVLLQVNK